MPSPTLFVVAGFCSLLPFADAVDWPQWRGTNRDGVSSEEISPASWGKDGPKQLWKKEIGTGVSSVAIEGGRLYTMGNNDDTDVVFCLDAATGAEIWQHTYPQSLALRQFEGGPAGTPTVDGGKVYTLSHEGDLFCLAASDGKVLWTKNLLRDFGGSRPRWGYAGSPLVDGDLVIVDSGGIPWKTAYDINAPTPLVLSDKIFITSGNATGCALLQVSPEEATQIWRNKNMRSQLGSSVLVRGSIFGIDGNVGKGELRCLDAASGEINWSQNIGGGALIAASAHLIVLNERGELVVAEASPTAYRELARAQVLGGRCWVAPAVANGKIYCKNNLGALVCLAGN